MRRHLRWRTRTIRRAGTRRRSRWLRRWSGWAVRAVSSQTSGSARTASSRPSSSPATRPRTACASTSTGWSTLSSRRMPPCASTSRTYAPSAGRQLEESGVLNGALKARGNSWGLHMPLVCPDGAVVAYAWKRQLAGQAGASAVDRTRLALKAFTDQKRRFFPHLEDEVVSHLHDGEPGGTKKPKLFTSNGDLEEKSLSDILKNLEHEASNIKIFTYWHLDWSKRASSLASLLDDDFVDPSKELNLQNMGKSRSGALTTSIDQVAVIELLVPSVFRAVVSLHPAGSTDPDAVAFFSPTEGGSYLHARGTSVHNVFKHVKEHADKALQYFISVEPSKALPLLLRWIASYQTLFTKVCSKCGRLLMMDKSLALLLPPVHRPYHQTSNIGPDLQEAYHIGCSSYDG
ncbi:mediator of RNA polymerase II transcription subunit 27 isoform X1 [Zea mays]|uniref:mediator of RNA polymerase II transcription subunit 27 isoform X1 n=1 Tax=Zea mays TaxID=4577 RepID=UPI0009A98752|nr:uncharacterized protein LOC100193632 isoform X1 [Zea mays]|eukprot:XP_020405072.1 uncharacterized protein LOC100193632 isoform X1 [Zea mays]